MTNKYTAIPLIVYVPHDHTFITSRGAEYAESALIDHLQLIGLEPLIAEDFASTVIESDSTLAEHAARISAVCPPATPTTNPGFDPAHEFESVSHAVEYCLSFPQPIFALEGIVSHNIHLDEMGFAADLLRTFPDGPLPATEKPLSELQTPDSTVDASLKDAAGILASRYALLTASYEYPGYVELVAHGLRFAFGNANGDGYFRYNYGPANDPGAPQQGGVSRIADTIFGPELAAWIADQVALFEPATEPTRHPLYHRPITTVDHAKEILHDLYERGLTFHPDDNPLDCLGGQLPPADCLALAHRMNEARDLPDFDPCTFLVNINRDDEPQPEPDWSATLQQLRSALTALTDYVQTEYENPANFNSSVVLDARKTLANSAWVANL